MNNYNYQCLIVENKWYQNVWYKITNEIIEKNENRTNRTATKKIYMVFVIIKKTFTKKN